MRYYLWGAVFVCIIIVIAIWGWGGKGRPELNHQPSSGNMTRNITPHPNDGSASPTPPANTAPARAGESQATKGVDIPKAVTK